MSGEATATPAVEAPTQEPTPEAPRGDNATPEAGGSEKLSTEAESAYESAFADEAVPSTAELMGEEPPAEPESEEPSGEDAANPQPKDGEGDVPAPEAKPDEGDKPEPKPEEEPKPEKDPDGKPDETKPPAGFVPQAALGEARAELRQLKRELAALQQQVAQPQVPQQQQQGQPPQVQIPEAMKADVEAFTQAFPTLKDLVQSDTTEGQRLRTSIEEYGIDDITTVSLAESYSTRIMQADMARQGQELANAREQARVDAFADECLDQMEKAVPGIFDKDNGALEGLAEAARNNGLDPNVVFSLTDPRAVISIPDGEGNMQQSMLGAGAVSVVKMLSLISGSNDVVSKADYDKAVAEAEARGAQQALGKLKEPGKGFSSLGETPNAGGDAPGTQGEVTEEQYARMSPEERERFLSGM